MQQEWGRGPTEGRAASAGRDLRPAGAPRHGMWGKGG
jgi:hypothetical protein